MLRQNNDNMMILESIEEERQALKKKIAEQDAYIDKLKFSKEKLKNDCELQSNELKLKL